MTIQNLNLCHIGRRVDKQGPRPGVLALAPELEKLATEPNSNLLRCKTKFLISTFNVRTLLPNSQMSELVASAETHKIDIICVQEHRFFHDDIDIKYQDIAKHWTFISSSACKNSVNSSIGGVGILLSPTALRSLNSIEKNQLTHHHCNI